MPDAARRDAARRVALGSIDRGATLALALAIACLLAATLAPSSGTAAPVDAAAARRGWTRRPATTARGYEIWFVGRVATIDVRRARLRIARGPTETAPPALVECTLARRALRRLRRGMDVRALADTRHLPWRIIHLRPFERFRPRGTAAFARAPVVALRDASGA